jgi:hypothetical protein
VFVTDSALRGFLLVPIVGCYASVCNVFEVEVVVPEPRKTKALFSTFFFLVPQNINM